MQTVPCAGCQFSRLMLGTVQFGMPYGIANTTGQPDYASVKAMLSAAADAGVNALDTAAAYGSSEEVLGRALQELGLGGRMHVVTKVQPLTPAESADPESAARAVRASVLRSRERLRLERIPVVLFHRENEYAHLAGLLALQREGLIGSCGVSCDNPPGPAADMANSGRVAALQIPANLLDRRHACGGSFRAAAEHRVAVFIRSVYLQGLLVMPEASVPPALAAVLPVRRRLGELAAAAGIGVAELALRYMLSQAGVSCVLTGVESLAQLRENVAMFGRGPLPADLLVAVDAAVPDLPVEVLTPHLWPKRT